AARSVTARPTSTGSDGVATAEHVRVAAVVEDDALAGGDAPLRLAPCDGHPAVDRSDGRPGRPAVGAALHEHLARDRLVDPRDAVHGELVAQQVGLGADDDPRPVDVEHEALGPTAGQPEAL